MQLDSDTWIVLIAAGLLAVLAVLLLGGILKIKWSKEHGFQMITRKDVPAREREISMLHGAQITDSKLGNVSGGQVAANRVSMLDNANIEGSTIGDISGPSAPREVNSAE